MTYRLIHGDCLDVMRTMDAASVDAVVTSPPYNQLGARIPKSPTGMFKGNGWLSKVSAVGYYDDMSEDDYFAWIDAVASEVCRVLRPGGSFWFNHKIRYRDKELIHPIDFVRSWHGFWLKQEIIWDRCGAMAFNARLCAPSDERVYWIVKDGAEPTWNQEAASYMTVWRIPPSSGQIDGHPCAYPESLPRRCIVASCNKGMTVLDPFTGSGTTGVAALSEGCKFIGIDNNAEYVAIAEARLKHASRAPLLPFAAAPAPSQLDLNMEPA